MSVIPVDREAAQAAIDRLAAKVGADLANHPAETGRPVPGLDWSVGETGAHLVTLIDGVTRYVTGDLRPEGAIADMAALNRRRIDLLPDRHGGVLGRLLLEAVSELKDVTRDMGGDEPVPWYDPSRIELAIVLSVLVGELSIHGSDIARGLSLPDAIEREDALLVLPAIWEHFPYYLDPEAAAGFTGVFGIAVRGAQPVRIEIADGVAAVSQLHGVVDCRITADPVAFVTVSYGRATSWSQILRGKMMATGSRPWLATRLPQLLIPV
jgi:hypothetical protein